MRLIQSILLGGTCAILVACGTKAIKPSDKHIQQTPDTTKHSSGVIPQTSKHAVVLPPPAVAKKVETYSVIFSNDIAVRDVLFTLGREAKINIDIKDGSDPCNGAKGHTKRN